MELVFAPIEQFEHFLTIAVPVGFKVVVAIVCGGLIGLEREFKNKPAGIKTNILICLGSALYTIISMFFAQAFSEVGFYGDPARIAAQIVPGIGFIGAGTIMRSKLSIVGLTTAATIWVVAAIGICIGAGYPIVAIVFTITVLFTLLAVNRFENKIFGTSNTHMVELVFEDATGEVREAIHNALKSNNIDLTNFEIVRSGHRQTLKVQYSHTANAHRQFLTDLWSIQGITEVKQSAN